MVALEPLKYQPSEKYVLTFILIAITIKLVFIDASGQRSQSETLGMVEYIDFAGRFHGFVVLILENLS